MNALACRLLRAVHRPLALLLGHGGLAVILIIWLPLVLVLLPVPRERRQRTTRRLIHHAMRAYRHWLGRIGALQFETRSLDALRDAPPGVIVANHPSLLDALVVLSHVPEVVCVMRAGILRNPFFALPARLAGYLPNDDAVEMMLGARRAIRGGCHVLLFPEGSRSPLTAAPPLRPFHPAPFMLAHRTGASLHPWLFRYDRPFLAKGQPGSYLPVLPIRLIVTPMAPLSEHMGTDPREMAAAWRCHYARAFHFREPATP